MSESITEGWILAGAVDGAPPAPLLADLAGMPVLLRHACELRLAGATRAVVIWHGDEAPPDIDAIAGDERLAGCALELVRAVPEGGDGDVLVVRGDRAYHRDVPKRLAGAPADAALRKVAGAEHDGVFAADRATARRLAAAAAERDGVAGVVAELDAAGGVVEVEPPYLGFCVPARDRAELRRAGRLLISSLRKSADGYAARLINRHISLLFTRFLVKTPVRPNHMTVLAFASAFTGGIIIGQTGYIAGVIGMLLVELGSILDGIDGELARLKCRFSKLGQWMDTVTDDVSNVCYWTGIMVSLRATGVEWAFPLWLATVIAFSFTQLTQYYLIAVIYKSGDLAAIPWAFQSTEFLSSRPRGLLPRLKAGIPKLLKRDFAVTLFLALAIAGRLDVVLLISAAGALSFFVSFGIQLLRVRPTRAQPGPTP